MTNWNFGLMGLLIFNYSSYRSRRDIVTAESVVYDIDLGQEILISNTPLSKEIYVETGTKVDPIKEQKNHPLLAGRENNAGMVILLSKF